MKFVFAAGEKVRMVEARPLPGLSKFRKFAIHLSVCLQAALPQICHNKHAVHGTAAGPELFSAQGCKG